MVWSNEYQADAACSLTNRCAQQYLLKSKVTASAPISNIVCTDEGTSLGGCGAVDDKGEPSDYWNRYPLCKDVDGRTGGSFEGECAYIGTCYQNGAFTGKWTSGSSTTNDCGNFNQMSGSEFEAFITGTADDTCKKICDESLSFEGRCSIKGSGKNTCTLYSCQYGCQTYVLTCTRGATQVKSEARKMRCAKV